MTNLRDIVNRTQNTKIVLSSTWRLNDYTMSTVNNELAKVGLEPCLCKTPDLEGNDRVSEIFRWMETFKGNILGWIAIDDMNLGYQNKMSGHFIHCDSYIGLTKELAAQAVELLNNLTDNSPTCPKEHDVESEKF